MNAEITWRPAARYVRLQILASGAAFLMVATLMHSNCFGGTDQIEKPKRNSGNQWDEYERKGRKLIAECPTSPDGYQDLAVAIQFAGREKAANLAKEIASSSAPTEIRLWAEGVLNRFGLMGKPVKMQFRALDKREVDLSKMQGRVVLIDFWGRECPHAS